MRRRIDRRGLLAIAAAVAVAAGPVATQSDGIRGVIGFEGGATIPAGDIVIRLEDPAARTDADPSVAETRIGSDGTSREIAFSLATTASPSAAPTVQVVARLERADGWLLARGAAKVEPGSPVRITLYAALY